MRGTKRELEQRKIVLANSLLLELLQQLGFDPWEVIDRIAAEK